MNEVNISFVNRGLDEATMKSMSADCSSEELIKAMNRQGLVQKEVQVKGKNGQTFTRKQWVKAGEDQPTQKQPKAQEETKDKKSSDSSDSSWKKPSSKQELAQMLASGMSRDDIMSKAKEAGVTWKEHEHAGINWMRCSMALTGTTTRGEKKENEKSIKVDSKVQEAKSKVKKSDDPTNLNSIFIGNEMWSGEKVLDTNDHSRTYNAQISESLFSQIFSDYQLQDTKEVTVGKSTMTVKELRPFMSEVNSVLDESYKGYPMVVSDGSGYLGNKIDTITINGSTYDVYDGGFDSNRKPEKCGYYRVVNTNAPKRLSNYMENLRKDIFSDALVENGLISTKKKALDFLGQFGTNWSRKHLEDIKFSPNTNEDNVRNWMLSKLGVNPKESKSVIGSDYTQLTTEEESGTVEGEAHNMMVGRLNSEGKKQPSEKEIKTAAKELKESAIKTVIKNFNQDTIVHELAMAKQFAKLSGESIEHMTLENLYKDVVSGNSSYTQEQKCNALSKLMGKDYDTDMNDNVVRYASNSMASVHVRPLSRGNFEVTFEYDDGERYKETYDSVKAVSEACDRFIKKEESKSGNSTKGKDKSDIANEYDAKDNLNDVLDKVISEWNENQSLTSDDIQNFKDAYDTVLDYHMDGDISKTEMNSINSKMIKKLRNSNFSNEIIRDLGFTVKTK